MGPSNGELEPWEATACSAACAREASPGCGVLQSTCDEGGCRLSSVVRMVSCRLSESELASCMPVWWPSRASAESVGSELANVLSLPAPAHCAECESTGSWCGRDC